MKLTNFTLDLKNNEPQPISAFSTNKNSFLILAKIKGEVNECETTIDIKTIHFSILHLDNDIIYNQIKEIKYGFRDGIHQFFLCMEVNETPYFNSLPFDTTDLILEIGKENIFRFHLKYDCESDGTIDVGNWPCNTVIAR
ncbi:hypothetical protein [Tenacibaculum halocynthiae]|uniref:hypothetical protein n=1 Tax=Tenacibaculum halocynthiae TaxID=1254437 RepID=UPI003D65F061